MTEPLATPDEVNRFHAQSDVDSSSFAQHHTIGIKSNQVSDGRHTHDGRNSLLLLAGKFPAFPVAASSPPTQSEVQACIDALRELGAGS